MVFCKKKKITFLSFFGTFWSKFLKILPKSNIWKKKKKKKKPSLEKCLHDLQAILAFSTQNYYFFLTRHKNFSTKKVIFCYFQNKR